MPLQRPFRFRGLITTAFLIGMAPWLTGDIVIDNTTFPNSPRVVTGTSCHSYIGGAPWDVCTSTAYYLANPIEGVTQFYQNAFNASNPGGWTVEPGGLLPGGKLVIKQFSPYISTKKLHYDIGGLTFQVDWTYTGADKNQFFWTQAILRNFNPANGQSQAENFSLDVLTPCDNTHANLSKTCPPLYPFQYADRHFYDKPQGPMPDAHEDFLAELAKVDWTAKKLTVYEGIGYGFQLAAENDPTTIPEPSSWIAALSGLAILVIARRRHRAMADAPRAR
jgi:hypothetical protein